MTVEMLASVPFTFTLKIEIKFGSLHDVNCIGSERVTAAEKEKKKKKLRKASTLRLGKMSISRT